MDTRSQLHATVEGHVQGVGFRQFVYQTAVGLDLTGWVRNTYDGDVEVLAEGSPAVLDMLLSALHKGPRMAYVTQVHFDFQPATGEFVDFRVRSTV
jgi:acylphosphatase